MNLLSRHNRVIEDPPVAKFLFSDTRMAWVWLVVRLYLGYQWLQAGLHKLTPAWLEGGAALRGFWEGATAIPAEGRPAIAFDWYREFILFLLNTESYTWFAKVIVYGEILLGIALIVGAFVGISAFFGAFLNWNFIMAGTASSNGLLFVLAILLMLAWKTAGYIGLDYFLLPFLGTPWKRGETRATSHTATFVA